MSLDLENGLRVWFEYGPPEADDYILLSGDGESHKGTVGATTDQIREILLAVPFEEQSVAMRSFIRHIKSYYPVDRAGRSEVTRQRWLEPHHGMSRLPEEILASTPEVNVLDADMSFRDFVAFVNYLLVNLALSEHDPREQLLAELRGDM